MRRPREAVALLKRNLSAFMRNYFQLAAWRLHHFEGSPIFKKDVSSEFAVSMLSPLPREDLPTWIHRLAETSWYIKASDGKIFLFDCGFPPVTHELDRLMQVKNIAGISGIWISHYHDDHVESVNEVRRKYKCKVYAQKEIVDILQNPNAYSMPALYPETIHVDYPLSEGETVEWKGYKLTGYFFPGQTLYHGGLLVEFERKRVFMSGDSFANWAISEVCSYNRNFLGKDGAVAGYERCIQLLLKLKPDVLVAAHYGSVPFSWKYLSRTLAILKEQAAVAARLFPWDDPNFGLDPRWVRAYPYRQSLLPGQPALVEARIYNHSDRPCRAYAALRVPRGWRVTNRPLPIIIDPHSEGSVRLMAVSPIHPLFYREVLGLAVNFDGRNLGEIAETIVDYLEG
jgi:glyoxylase-like metal-dependent hydrolase (beta-lactamase superfamily II)